MPIQSDQELQALLSSLGLDSSAMQPPTDAVNLSQTVPVDPQVTSAQANPQDVAAMLKLMQASGLVGSNYNPGATPSRTDATYGPSSEQPPVQSNSPMDGPAQEAFTLAALAKGLQAPPDTYPAGMKKAPITEKDKGFAINAADFVNADQVAKDAGIKGFINERGSLTLTNVGANGVVNPSVTQAAVAGAGGPAGIRNIITSMQATKDPDVMRGLQATLNEAMAAQSAQIQTDAMKFAENKLGIPQLQATLLQAQTLDRQDPMYKPGMGDSPNTAKIRQQLDVARGYADAEAKRYLAGNTSAAALRAAETTANNEATRVTKLADRKDMLTTGIDARSMERQAEQQDRLTAAASGLSDNVKANAKILDPNLADKPDTELFQSLQKKAKDKSYLSAVNAPDEDLPKLAVAGNTNALHILLAKEQATTGADPAIIKSRVDTIGKIMTNPVELKKGLALMYPDKKQQDEAFASMNTKTVGTPEEKQMAANEKYQVARTVEQAVYTNKWRNDASQWGSVDPRVNWAIAKSKEVTGKTDYQSVMNAYLDGAQGPDATNLVNQFTQALQSAATKQSGLLGMPDYIKMRNELIASQAKKGFLGAAIDQAQKTIGMFVPGVADTPEEAAAAKIRGQATNKFLFGE